MREVFPGGCHLFVFVNHLVPVDRYFSNENVTAAVESINKNVPSRGIYSNYGVPLKELRYDNTGIINKDTTIVMLGDCRNNKNYSGVEEVEWLSKRASNFFVLNPDPLNKWGARGLYCRPLCQEWCDGLPGEFNAGFAYFFGVCKPQKASLIRDHNIWCMSQFVYIPYTIYCGFRIDYPYILWYNANVLRKGATSKSPEHAPVAQLAEQLSCNQ